MFAVFGHFCALRRGSISSSTASSGGQQQPQPPKEDAATATEEEMKNLSPDPEDAAAAPSNPAPDSEAPSVVEPAVRKTKTLRLQIRENSWFGKKCLKIFKLFTNTFAMTFLAEWGDR
jgi:putative Ca2+/H+ antiporter (TMEM165/GDT1 family)